MTVPPPLPRAGFVTVMAKISLLLGALGVAGSAAQALLALLMPDAAVATLAQRPEVPAGVVWVLEWRLALSLLCLLLSALFLAASWGLLRRREWARWTFIAFLVGGAVLNFAGLAAIGHVFDTLQAMFPADMIDTPEGREFLAQMQASRYLSYVTGLVGAVAFAVLHGWIAWKLCTAPARDEFRRPAA
ncbi:hypothetical protein B1992_10955 [Pseudoxanthomonas broegbernensis]|uniref:Uncharacterized protein n=1 Tax=Pseudoxanthomonas broegbernensis TaxID=83619 RepID=A0A7V8GLG4_9GAMM|nr:hypothetical protein [Pseudoxanthomonas broegbernensis]KAF1685710.1 hypothetical protein B1992_10955 [Pseudoxanthomonas broegbernensis]MBB6066056.1 hypothetical protein [Pseudoxanthomonas broegbernensis]